jgi:5-methylcytosine-specific restriction endonuclease McrA
MCLALLAQAADPSSADLNTCQNRDTLLEDQMSIQTSLQLGKRSQKHKLRAVAKQRFGGACAYCGCIPHVLTLDHVVPRSKGGLDVRSNLVAVCRPCNKSKGSRLLWEWWQSSPCWNEARATQLAASVLVCKI